MSHLVPLLLNKIKPPKHGWHSIVHPDLLHLHQVLCVAFCFHEKLMTIPFPNIIPALVWPLQSQWTPYAASMNYLEWVRLSTARHSFSVCLPFIYLRTLFNFPSCLCLDFSHLWWGSRLLSGYLCMLSWLKRAATIWSGGTSLLAPQVKTLLLLCLISWTDCHCMVLDCFYQLLQESLQICHQCRGSWIFQTHPFQRNLGPLPGSCGCVINAPWCCLHRSSSGSTVAWCFWNHPCMKS